MISNRVSQDIINYYKIIQKKILEIENRMVYELSSFQQILFNILTHKFVLCLFTNITKICNTINNIIAFKKTTYAIQMNFIRYDNTYV